MNNLSLALLDKSKLPIQKVLVAFSVKGDPESAVVIACDGDIIQQEIDDMSPFLDELPEFGQNPDHGIWVWEGIIYGIQDNTPDSCDWDTVTEGDWRHPTAEEWEKIQKQEDPWFDIEKVKENLLPPPMKELGDS